MRFQFLAQVKIKFKPICPIDIRDGDPRKARRATRIAFSYPEGIKDNLND